MLVSALPAGKGPKESEVKRSPEDPIDRPGIGPDP
jgi:hypothetical protein